MRILMTGGSGLLGRNLKIEADRPTHSDLNILYSIDSKPYDLIIHAAAFTDTIRSETDRLECFDVNVRGTLNLLIAYPNTPFVFISTEYAKNPANFYSLTKSLAEQLVTTHPNYLIIRTLFKSRPWKYEYAFNDVFTLGGYVENVAPLIDKAIQDWNRKDSGLIYVGDGRGEKSMLDLARETKVDVKANSKNDKKGIIISK